MLLRVEDFQVHLVASLSQVPHQFDKHWSKPFEENRSNHFIRDKAGLVHLDVLHGVLPQPAPLIIPSQSRAIKRIRLARRTEVVEVDCREIVHGTRGDVTVDDLTANDVFTKSAAAWGLVGVKLRDMLDIHVPQRKRRHVHTGEFIADLEDSWAAMKGSSSLVHIFVLHEAPKFAPNQKLGPKMAEAVSLRLLMCTPVLLTRLMVAFMMLQLKWTCETVNQHKIL